MQNLEKKENIIMRNSDFATMMQQQEEDKAQKSKEKEQRFMSSMLKVKALIIIQSVLSLHRFLQSSIPHNFGVDSKVTTLAMYSMCFFTDRLLHLQNGIYSCWKNATLDIG